MVDPLSGGPAGFHQLLPRQASLHSAQLPAVPTGDPGWILVEEGFTLAREHEVESLFAIGNGYAGSRGSLAEGSALSAPATFVAGVFNSKPGSVPELRLLRTGPVWLRQSTASRFGPIGDITLSTDASWTCGKAFSGGSGGIRTKPVGSRSYEHYASYPWPIATSWFNV